jgi:hypothetical protein
MVEISLETNHLFVKHAAKDGLERRSNSSVIASSKSSRDTNS